jgi:hypothetical protein
MAGEQPGLGRRQGQDGYWHSPGQDMQTGAPGHPLRALGRSPRDSPEKVPRSRFGEWVQTTQRAVWVIASIVALVGCGPDAAHAAHHGSSSSSTAPTSPIAARFTQTASTARLAHALLPAQALGGGAIIRNSGTDLADLSTLCGDPLPGGGRLTAYETLQDGQTGQYLQEVIIEWDSSGDAAGDISNDRAAIGQRGHCSSRAGGQTAQSVGLEPGSAPRECANGQYVATQLSIRSASLSLLGYDASAQCGLYTISATILGGAGSTVNHDTVDGYLSSAVAKLQQTLGQP